MTELRQVLPDESPDPMTIKPKMTLGEILSLMQANDEGLVDLTAAEMEELRLKAELKVDGYKRYMEELEKEEFRLARRIKEHQAAKKTVDGKIAHLKKLAVFHMQRNGFKRLTGDEYKVDLRSSKSVVTKAEPSDLNYLKYGDFMRIKYEWDKPKIKAGLKESAPAAMEIAEIVETFSAQFTVNKGIADD